MKRKARTIDLLELTSSDQSLFILEKIFIFHHKASYFNKRSTVLNTFPLNKGSQDKDADSLSHLPSKEGHVMFT